MRVFNMIKLVYLEVQFYGLYNNFIKIAKIKMVGNLMILIYIVFLSVQLYYLLHFYKNLGMNYKLEKEQTVH